MERASVSVYHRRRENTRRKTHHAEDKSRAPPRRSLRACVRDNPKLCCKAWDVLPELAGECRPQGISYYTLLRRLKNPQEFTLGEISALAKVLDIPIDELRACIVKA